MFFDLNVSVAPDARAHAARACARLGFDVIAFNATHCVRKLGPEHHPPPPLVLEEAPDAAAHDPHVLRVARPGQRRTGRIRTLNRITLVVDDPACLVCLSSPVLAKYDLVAVAPTSEKLLQQCLQFDFDIVSLDLCRRPMFYLKRPQLHVASEKGTVFEITYAGLLADAQSRRFLVGNACAVTRVTSGKQLIISSGCTDTMGVRGPHDVINLAHVFGLGPEQARQAVGRAAEKTVIHGDVRARTSKGVVRFRDDGVTLWKPEKMDVA